MSWTGSRKTRKVVCWSWPSAVVHQLDLVLPVWSVAGCWWEGQHKQHVYIQSHWLISILPVAMRIKAETGCHAIKAFSASFNAKMSSSSGNTAPINTLTSTYLLKLCLQSVVASSSLKRVVMFGEVAQLKYEWLDRYSWAILPGVHYLSIYLCSCRQWPAKSWRLSTKSDIWQSSGAVLSMCRGNQKRWMSSAMNLSATALLRS